VFDMVDIVCKTVYFEKAGLKNTEERLKLTKMRAKELGIENVVVASTTGETGVKASKVFKGYNLVVDSHVTGFKKPDFQQLVPENRIIIENNGAKILTTAHAFGASGRAVTKKFWILQVDGIVSAVLRLFGQSVKVSCEIEVWLLMRV
jgi:hypothetical protein